MSLLVHGHFDVLCDGCGDVLHTEFDKPMIAANHAEVVGWSGIPGRRGMFCPACLDTG